MDQFLTLKAAARSPNEPGCRQRLQQVRQEAQRGFKLSRVHSVLIQQL